ncbi:uncharacterized protein LOC125234429 [Leguminivora glycinivorella]|uniref:uncharacterized protein LOC125234429 n=1 Tax=Leguminivora glycinivorella TaxID=1035111 RepID=UPI00200E6025|nr:uncharacterized protein LOC125234429 [Leguminivora glycinivorella]
MRGDGPAYEAAIAMKNVAIILFVAVASHMVVATPIPEPGGHRTHIRIHVPYDVHTIHHHHVEKVPILHEVPVIKEVPILKEIIKHVPVVNTVHVPVVETVAVEKPVFVPVPYKSHGWH